MLGGLALAAVAGFVALLGAAGPAHAAAGSCSVYWTGNGDGNWTQATNWSLQANGSGTGRVPLTSDVVCLATSPARTTIDYFSLSRTVAGLNLGVDGTVRPTLRVHGGILTVGSGSGSFSSVINNLELLEGGVLRGTADHTLTGAPVLSDNAILEGSGTTTIPSGVTVTTNGLIVDQGRRLVVAGHLTHSGCYDYLYLYGGAVLENTGRFTAASSCGMQLYSDGSDGSRIINQAGATFEVDQPATTTYSLAGVFENHGTVAVDTGTLLVRPTSTTNGRYDLGPSSVLMVGPGGTLRITATTLPGNKDVTVTGGTVTVDDGVALDVVDVLAGRLSGGPVVTTLKVSPGGILDGGGTVTVAPGGTASVDGLVIDGGTLLRNRGTMTHVDCTAPLQLRNGSDLTNEGTWKLPCGQSVEGDGSSGVLVKNASTGLIDGELPAATQEYHFDARTTNDGRLEMAKGRIEFHNLSNFTGGTLTGGDYVLTGGLLELPAELTTNAATIRLESPGDIVTPSGAKALLRLSRNTGDLTLRQALTLSVGLTNSGTFRITAGTSGVTVKPKSYTQTAGATIIEANGNLVAANGAGAIDINGGSLSGAGKIGSIDGGGTVNPTGTMSVTGQYRPTAGATYEVDVEAAGRASKLAVNGNVYPDGTLRLVTAPGYTPARGATWTIMTFGFRSGTFDVVTGVNLPGGNYYDVKYNSTTITITVKQVAQVTAADGEADVGFAGNTPMAFDVTLDEASSQEVRVHYETVEGSALALLDFLPASGELVFSPGATTQTIVVMIVVDLQPEPQETFTLVLRDPVGAELARATATGWIDHYDDAPTAPVVDGVTEPTVGLGAQVVERTITGEHFRPTSVVTVAGTGLRLDSTTYVDPQTLLVTVTATASTTPGPNDLTVTNPGVGTDTCVGCLVVTERPQPIGDGQSLATGASDVVVTVTGSRFEPGATGKITGGTGVSASSQWVSDTELRLTVTVTEAATLGPWDIRVTNPDDGVGVCTGCFTVAVGPTLTGMSPAVVARDSTTTVTFSGSGFAPGATLVAPAEVSFDDVTVVDGETLTATMTVTAQRAKGVAVPVTVVNPLPAGAGSARCGCLEVATMVSAPDVSTEIGTAGPVELLFEVRLDTGSATETRVSYATADRTAQAGSDFEPVGGTLVFPPYTTVQTVAVTVLANVEAEGDETFALALSAPVNARLATAGAIASLIDSDDAVPAPLLTGVSPATVGIGATAKQLTLSGDRFHPTSTVAFSGKGVAVTAVQYVDAGTLRVTISAWTTAAAGARDVTVTNPGSGSSTCTACLTAVVAPAASSAAPSLATGATQRQVTVTAAHLQPGVTVAFRGGSGVVVASTTYLSGTAVRVTVSVYESATVGWWDIKLTNPDGGTSTCNDCYRVQAGPEVLAMTPPAVLRGATLPVVITGTGFAAGATVTGPTGVTFSNVVVLDATTITATIRVDLSRGRGVDLPITVHNPASGGWGQGTGRVLTITI